MLIDPEPNTCDYFTVCVCLCGTQTSSAVKVNVRTRYCRVELIERLQRNQTRQRRTWSTRCRRGQTAERRRSSRDKVNRSVEGNKQCYRKGSSASGLETKVK